MCCSCRMCMLCLCVILVVIAIGMVFGFGVYKNGFHKLKDAFHASDPNVRGSDHGRPFMVGAPPPF